MATKSFFLRKKTIDELFTGKNDWDVPIEEWTAEDPDVHVVDENGNEITDIDKKDEYLRLIKFLVTAGKPIQSNKPTDKDN